MVRWESDTNIIGQPYIYDNQHKRQYWLWDEHYIIASILNNQEEKIEGLESKLESNESVMIPTVYSEVIDNLSYHLKQKINSTFAQKEIGVSETFQTYNGNIYKISMSLTKIEED